MNQPPSDEEVSGSWLAKIIGLYLLAFALNALLLIFVMWKEYPPFWRNDGGYPVWLRDLVLTTFYPLLAIQFGLLAATSFFQFCHLPLENTNKVWALVGVITLWVLFGIVLTVLLANNIDNLLNGRELHYHPLPTSS